MTLVFDEVVPALVRSAETSGAALAGIECTIVRGLDGKVRLAIEGQLSAEDRDRLRAALGAIGPYAASTTPVLLGTRTPDEFVSLVRQHRRPLSAEVAEWLGRPAVAAWHTVERRFSKDSWLSHQGEAQEPWPYTDDAPKVVSFYAFKGGVGPTTALTAFALHLVELGRSVVVVDLDLEAPGVGALLQSQDRDLGVVDFLIEEHIQPSAVPLDRFYQTVGPPVASGAGTLRVFPAGRLGFEYLEKLGRIDIQGLMADAGAARSLLRRLLDRVRSELRPEVVLLDVRAGLHDLGGISLSGLSHLELAFGLHTPPSWEGLRTVLDHLGHLRADWVRLVHALVPPATRGGDALHDEFVQMAYDVCREVYYRAGEVPAFEDPDAAHQAYRLPYREALLAIRDIAQSRRDMLADEHRAFCERLALDLGVTGD